MGKQQEERAKGIKKFAKQNKHFKNEMMMEEAIASAELAQELIGINGGGGSWDGDLGTGEKVIIQEQISECPNYKNAKAGY